MMTIHGMATWMITEYGGSDLIQLWAEPLVTGQKLASYCLTESGQAVMPLL